MMMAKRQRFEARRSKTAALIAATVICAFLKLYAYPLKLAFGDSFKRQIKAMFPALCRPFRPISYSKGTSGICTMIH